jgi:hypothetical protein
VRPVYQTVGALAAGPWIPINYIESWFGVGLYVTLSGDASSITYTVDYTGDDPSIVAVRPVTISRTTTTATVTDNGPVGSQYPYDTGNHHGLVTGDSVVVTGSGSANFDGTQPITYVSPTTYTYPVANSGASADTGNAKVVALRVFNHANLTGLSIRAQGTLNYPVTAVRLRLSAWAAGQATLGILQGQPR